MNTKQQLLDSLQPKLRLSEIERLIKHHRIIVPPPSRRTLIALCDEGTLLAAPRKKRTLPILVFEDSFLKWVKSLDKS